ncbi:MAG TPA: RodZ domain-containing protein [Terriglobales bacterium]
MGAIGERLRLEREKKKISLDDVAKITKISARMLRAIEEERFDQLPGGIFNKGFVRAYARHLGLDEHEAVADYVAASQPAQPEESETVAKMAMELQAQRQPRAGARLPWGTMAAVLLLAGFGFALWGSFGRPSRLKSSNAAIGKRSTPAAQPPVENHPAPEENAATTAPALPQVEQSAEKAPASNPEAPPPATTDETSSAAFRVLIRAHENAWVRITADGKEVMQDTLQAPAEKSIAAHHELVIKTGNIQGLELWFNGQKVLVEGDPHEVKTLFFESSGLVASTATIQPQSP